MITNKPELVAGRLSLRALAAAALVFDTVLVLGVGVALGEAGRSTNVSTGSVSMVWPW